VTSRGSSGRLFELYCRSCLSGSRSKASCNRKQTEILIRAIYIRAIIHSISR